MEGMILYTIVLEAQPMFGVPAMKVHSTTRDLNFFRKTVAMMIHLKMEINEKTLQEFIRAGWDAYIWEENALTEDEFNNAPKIDLSNQIKRGGTQWN